MSTKRSVFIKYGLKDKIIPHEHKSGERYASKEYEIGY